MGTRLCVLVYGCVCVGVCGGEGRGCGMGRGEGEITWSTRKRCLAWLMRCSTTTVVSPNDGCSLDCATSPSTISVSTTSWRYSGSGRLLRTPSSLRANFSSPEVICEREKEG